MHVSVGHGSDGRFKTPEDMDVGKKFSRAIGWGRAAEDIVVSIMCKRPRVRNEGLSSVQARKIKRDINKGHGVDSELDLMCQCFLPGLHMSSSKSSLKRDGLLDKDINRKYMRNRGSWYVLTIFHEVHEARVGASGPCEVVSW